MAGSGAKTASGGETIIAKSGRSMPITPSIASVESRAGPTMKRTGVGGERAQEQAPRTPRRRRAETVTADQEEVAWRAEPHGADGEVPLKAREAGVGAPTAREERVAALKPIRVLTHDAAGRPADDRQPGADQHDAVHRAAQLRAGDLGWRVAIGTSREPRRQGRS